MTAAYTLTASGAKSVVTLTMGGENVSLQLTLTTHNFLLVPQSGTVFKHLGRAFQLYLGFESADLRLTLTSQTGDCDLFVRLGSSGSGPGPAASPYESDFHSSNVGHAVDSVLIPETQICQDCVVSVYVYGYATSRFSLVAASSDSEVTLSNGVPQKGSVASGRMQFYSYVTSSPVFGPNVSEGKL